MSEQKRTILDAVREEKYIPYTLGIDLMRPHPPHSVQECRCKACDTEMKVEREQAAINSRFGGVPKHDRFTCPNSGEEWHNQLVRLVVERDKTNSQKLTDIYNEEIKEIIQTRKATKKPRFW